MADPRSAVLGPSLAAERGGGLAEGGDGAGHELLVGRHTFVVTAPAGGRRRARATSGVNLTGGKVVNKN